MTHRLTCCNLALMHLPDLDFLVHDRLRSRRNRIRSPYGPCLTPETERCICCNSAPLGGGDERVPERMRGNGLGDPGAARDLTDDPPRAVPVQAPPVRSQEHRPGGALGDGQVDRPGGAGRERDGDHLAALAGNG